MIQGDGNSVLSAKRSSTKSCEHCEWRYRVVDTVYLVHPLESPLCNPYTILYFTLFVKKLNSPFPTTGSLMAWELFVFFLTNEQVIPKNYLKNHL